MNSSPYEEIDALVKKGKLPPFVAKLLRKFYQSYTEAALQNGYELSAIEPRLMQLLHFAVKQIGYPYRFEPFHKKITRPFDYYRFGLDFIRPLIDFEQSTVKNVSLLDKIEKQIEQGENVIFLANHQIEPDPQVISLMLEKTHPRLAEELIFVAGHRVITDPLAVPFSLGRNLICIFSKKHIEHPPEEKAAKLVHNQRSMKKMSSLLSEGGKCIYVAPSGGRDRPNTEGKVLPAPFDSSSLEMFLLMAKKGKTRTHFYPLILSTYQILPPPNTVEKDIGEKREAAFAPVHLIFEDEVDLEKLGEEIPDKQERRKSKAETVSKIILNAYQTLLCLLFFFAPFHLTSEEPFEVIHNEAVLPLLNPSYQAQKVEKIRLKNGLEAVLVSDPTTKQSAVTLTVLAGSWLEPNEFPGLAHFLEHMLFMGTTEYPDENSFNRFMMEHGGQTNAFTHGDYTSFMFSLNTDALPEGLKRFSSLFKTPLFNPSGVQRELNAIDQEFAQGFNNEDVRQFHVLKHLASSLHPFSRFQTGNSQSLAKATTADLKKWFEEHYSANLMKLYVLSSDSLDHLRALVIENFSGIPNRNLKPYERTQTIFTKDVLGHLVRIVPKNATQTLNLVWEIPSDLSPLLESRPSDLICLSVGYEGKNSLFAQLKKEGLADGISCGTSDLGSKTNLLTLEVKLTAKGVEQWELVVSYVFQALHLITEHAFPEYLFEDYSQMLKQKYQFQQRDEPFDWAMDQATLLAQEPLSTYPELSKTLKVFDPLALHKLLNILTPQNAIFVLASPGQKLAKIEPRMQVAYDVEKISDEQLKLWENVGFHPDIKLPPKNPFLAHSPKPTHQLIDKDTYPALAAPSLILDTAKGKIYYAQDPFYQVPRSSFLLQIQSPEIQDGEPARVVMAELYIKALKDHLQDFIDAAQMADMEVSIDKGLGSLQIELEGFTESLIAFLPHLIANLSHLELSEEKFDQIRDTLAREYENTLTASPIKQAFDRFKAIVFQNYTTFNQKNSAIGKITLPLFQQFQNELLKKTFLKGTVTGSITKEETKQLMANLNDKLSSLPSPPYYAELKDFKEDALPLIDTFDSKAEGSALFLALEMKEYNPKMRNIQEILSQALSEAFFAELRTNQQTGYIVFEDALESQKHLFNFFAVQSTTHTPQELLWRTELFISNYGRDLNTIISKERFEILKKSLVKQLKTPPATLKLFGEEIFKLAFDIEDFGWKTKRLDELDHLTYEEFIKSSQALLSRTNPRRFAVALIGQSNHIPPFDYKTYHHK